MKKIIDDKNRIVEDMLVGYAAAFPSRVKLVGENVLCRAKKKEFGKVGVIIGNGSGHEPAMIDLVGHGLFDVNVCGRIFTAPSPLEMLAGIKLADNGAGVLILVSSHQGDILNAKMAVMLAKAEGINVQMVVLWDDISSAPKGQESERRGTAGLFFTFKIVGAAAEAGLGMEALIRLAEKVRDNTRTLSVAVSGGTHPVTGLKTFELPDDEIEVGMGVHGEAGSGRMKLLSSMKITEFMLAQILGDLPFKKGDEVMVLVNNSGATTRMELMIIFKNIAAILQKEGIVLLRNWVGTYVTTQESAGFAISVCKTDRNLTDLYDAEADSPLF